jgi:hypothetical protein
MDSFTKILIPSATWLGINSRSSNPIDTRYIQHIMHIILYILYIQHIIHIILYILYIQHILCKQCFIYRLGILRWLCIFVFYEFWVVCSYKVLSVAKHWHVSVHSSITLFASACDMCLYMYVYMHAWLCVYLLCDYNNYYNDIMVINNYARCLQMCISIEIHNY